MIEIFFICLAFGVLSGILAGLFGIGGGLILVPFFLFLFKFKAIASDSFMLLAVATSLATIIITSLASSLAHHRLGSMIKAPVIHLSIGMVIGVILGAVFANSISSNSLKIIFCLYLLFVALQMAMSYQPQTGNSRLKASTLNIAGITIGFMSALLGIGGGTLTVPYLVKHQIKMKNAVAISSACGFPIAIVGTLSYAILGWNQTDLPAACLGYIYLPAFFGIILSSLFTAPLGAKWANKLPTAQLKRYFSILLLLTAGKVIFSY